VGRRHTSKGKFQDGDFESTPIPSFIDYVYSVANKTKSKLIPYIDRDVYKYGDAFRRFEVALAVGGPDGQRFAELCKEAKLPAFTAGTGACDVQLKIGKITSIGFSGAAKKVPISLWVSGVPRREVTSWARSRASPSLRCPR
jgi:hypothetical protein